MGRFIGFGGAVPRYLNLKRSQYWTDERFRRYVTSALRESLEAAARIPYYAERLGSHPVSPEQLPILPILPRAEIPAVSASVSALYPNTQLLTSRTSGSTGMPVSFFFDASHQAGRFAARARYLMENGWNPLLRSAWIMNVAMDSPDGALTRGSRFLGSRFFPHTSEIEAQAKWLREFDPQYLYAYPVNFEALVQLFEGQHRPLPRLRKIFSGSEVLDASLRERLVRTFGVAVADNYGSTEAFLAWECPAGSYHINAEHVIVEVVDDAGNPSRPGALGRVLVTTLQNRIMPLVRYEIGDYAIATDRVCSCGRTLPCIGRIIGRGVNLFIGKDGRRFVPWDLFRPLKDRTWIRQYQIAQTARDRFRIRYVASRALAADDEAAVQRHFENILRWKPTLEFEKCDVIARARSGKFMTAICEIE
jgi:phenylacetate-coenzyme A ligase PaaK-like adenylate-forming protein